MPRIAFAVLLLALTVFGPQVACAETAKEARKMERFELRAERTGLEHRIFLVRPAEPPPPGGYPVIHLLDGNATVPMMEKAIGQAPPEPYGSAVVVGSAIRPTSPSISSAVTAT